MFGKIIKIDGNTIILKNNFNETETGLMNIHVIFEESDTKIVGEITKIDDETITILLIGEVKNNIFSPGVVKKPSSKSNIRLINEEEITLLIGKEKIDSLKIGESAIYKNHNITISVNSFFANHSAIIGNTGSGKSCGVTRILQNLFINSEKKPANSHIVLFDAYGEYTNAFDEMNKIPGLGVKKYTTKIQRQDEEILKIPLHFLNVDDLAILLSVSDRDQIPILEKTLKLVYIFTSEDPTVKEYKNDIIAKCLLDILTSGKSGSQMRDQIIAVLSHYNTESLNLNSIIKQPGYDRTLKQCLLIDAQGKMNAILQVTEFLQQYEKVTLENIVINNEFIFTLKDLYYALEFALISEGTINNSFSYNKNNILKTRLQTLINSENAKIFDVNKYISKEDYIRNMFTNLNGNAQLININLNYVDDRFAKVITKIFSKLFFNYTTKLKNRGSFSINIILEEAHRYVENDNDIEIIGYNIFDRITKEGRKYGTILTFITQRPSELSETALSQCSNFIVFRIFHPKDFEIVKSISTNVTEESLEKLKTLNAGTCMVFGSGFKIPLLAKLELPSPLPESTSLEISNLWYE